MRPVLFLLLCLLTLAGHAGESPRQHLQAFLDGLHTLMADFEQQVVDTDTNEVSRVRGTLYVSRPGRFRWEYDDSGGRYLLADGHTVWLVEPDLEQVSQRSQKEALKGTPAGLFADQVDLDKDFEVEELGTRQGVSWLKLTPRDEQSQVAQILIGLEGDRITRLEMDDRLGQVTSFRFTHVEKNMPLPEELFRFVPPPGYDVLDQ